MDSKPVFSNKKSNKLKLDLFEVYKNRDLLFLFIRRDIVTVYKQTILGPLWFIIQPLFVSFTQFIVFGKLAKIPSDGTPYFLFVLAGNTLWGYFSTSFMAVADTFKRNEGIFGKVYFPRSIMPISVTISNLLKFSIQFLLFLIVLFWVMAHGQSVHPNWFILTTPIILLLMALISMGIGMIVTSISIKYKDFNFLLSFGITLLMYITPVVYPTSLFLSEAPINWQWIIYANPLTGIFDLFRYAFLGQGFLNVLSLVWSVVFAVIIYFFGLVVFNKAEKNFMDTI